MKITFLGTNGWYDTETGNTPCVFIETNDSYIVLDAGIGFYKVKDLVKGDKPVHLFISHVHLDHLFGLHTLPKFKLQQGITIHAPKNVLKQVRAFLRRPFTTPPMMLSTKVRFSEISQKSKFPFEFKYLPLRHSIPCFGYRFTSGGVSVTYCTDTGLCSNLKKIAKDADLLITECAMAPGDKGVNLFHITPETAARAAKEARAKRLALCHFDPGNYPTLAHRLEAERAAQGIFPNTIAAADGMVIEV